MSRRISLSEVADALDAAGLRIEAVVLRGIAEANPSETTAREFLWRVDRTKLPPLLRVRLDVYLGRPTL